jgi:hypothetical protein
MKRKKKEYDLHPGMVLEKQFYGTVKKLEVVQVGADLQFQIDGKLFKSLTAAARHVMRDDTKQISGPDFWSAPLAT